MNIKSLLLGSAAALAAVSGAQAADAIVAAQPEPVEYVRVCDAFGTGYFYIPGTETCLKIGGYVRFQVDMGKDTNTGADDDWDAWTRGRLEVVSKSDTELGTLTGFFALQAEASQDSTSAVNDPFYFDQAYIQLGGFKVGTYLTWWDKGLNGEADDIDGNFNRGSAVSYTYTGAAFTAGIQLDEITRTRGNNGQGLGIEALVTTKLGAASFDLLGSYDLDAEDGAIRAILAAPVGPGTLQAALLWSSGEGKLGTGTQAYYEDSEWSLAASYAWKAAPKLTLTPAFQYYWNSQSNVGVRDFQGSDYWRAGLTVDYSIVKDLNLKVAVNYTDDAYFRAGTNRRTGDAWTGFVRLDRNF